jgi:two-component system chemotaxis sensor kinase CheA
MDDLLAEFVTEAGESLAELDIALLKLEQTPSDAETLGRVFRLVHTIKGTCGFLGLTRLEHLAHAAENVLGRLRDGSLIATPPIISVILRAVDRLKVILDGVRITGAEPEGDDTALIAALGEVMGEVMGDGETPPTEREALPASPAPTVAQDVSSPEPLRPEMKHETERPGSRPQTLRVNVDILEELMTLVGELVLTRNQLLQIDRTQQNAAFAVPLQRLSHITTDLQEGVMKTRMQPIGNAWNKLPRLVRDLTQELEKPIELDMHGAETELDRQVLELIRDPLTHMVRNSADHGLETPAERQAAGKTEPARISLNAYHEGGHIIIEVSDNGRGLPLDKIRARLLARGLVNEADLASMSENDVHRFIFYPGFSTSASVTAISGRGVGMDVVKTNVEKIGGTIDVRSTVGFGTVFRIKIPLTLAIVSALILAAGGERFAIPQISIVELVRTRGRGEAGSHLSEPIVDRIDETLVLRLRERLLPLVNLAELLNLPSPPVNGEGLHIVVIQIGASSLGLIVDQVFDTEEIVVKPVSSILRHLTLFSGNTILGDGSVIMILDPNGIARLLGVGASGITEKRAQPAITTSQSSADRTSMLLFRVGENRMAVPLGLVSRLEDIRHEQIERVAGRLLTQYRGMLMPLIPIAGVFDGKGTPAGTNASEKGRTPASHPVLVFLEGGRGVGLIVDEIIDVVEQHLHIALAAERPGVLGVAVIAGHATDVIDAGHWLTHAHKDWFSARPSGAGSGPAVLVVEDNDFFRQMVVPILAAAGYTVTAAADGAQALRLLDAGETFRAIVSDIEMPGMSGLEFARRVRASHAWLDAPLIALTGLDDKATRRLALEAGFSEVVNKLDRGGLLSALERHLTVTAAK